MDHISVHIKRQYSKWKTYMMTSMNRKRLKTAFQVWLFFAILKAMAVLVVWLGLASVLHRQYEIFGADREVVVSHRSTETMAVLNSTRLICHLASQIGRLEYSLDERANDATEHMFRKVIGDGHVSARDVENFINFGRSLESSFVRAEQPSAKERHNEEERYDDNNVIDFKHQTRPKILRTLSKGLSTIIEKKGKVKNVKLKHLKLYIGSSLHPWQKWQNAIDQHHLYDKTSNTDQLLSSLASVPVSEIQDHSTRTQMQLLLKLKDGTQAIFKPMRVSRNEERNPDVFFWHDLERHHAEIAAFHLDRYCDTIKSDPLYIGGRRLLDMMDISIFDYLIGNQARQHYYTIKPFGSESFPMLYDNGHGFSLVQEDDHLILTPLRQCCLLRQSTLQKLIRLVADKTRLSTKMRKSLDRDPLSSGIYGPLLTDDNLVALDRRLNYILGVIYSCVQAHGASHVLTDDVL
ncbi:hypothetical protein LSH36_139g04032 [Paralvinella palmiformis]|uniref:FAM20 C-terminal domain-containing protein n=1 Tax=Paralvinella palmiformis TaxID=53620 RepID=A0AAD9JWJ1_9ANNE|nr:hypothetical protein LSH36_139g04032 [Paralvinella palmiformis]